MSSVTLPEFDYKRLWINHFAAQIAERLEQSEIDPSEWRASGRASKAYPNKEDEGWWNEKGPELIEAYRDWRESCPWVLWTTPAGQPAIELDLRCTFGSVPVRAIIDRVFVTPDGELAVVDLKSGANPPQDQGLQLGFYASALEVVFDHRPAICAYWNARKGGLSEPKNIDHLTPAYLGNLLGEFVRARDLGIFLPNPSSFCESCGVRRACPLVNGPEASLYLPEN